MKIICAILIVASGVTAYGQSCSYTLSPTSIAKDINGTIPAGPVVVSITASSPQCGWSAVINPTTVPGQPSGIAWATVYPASGTGHGSVQVQVNPNYTFQTITGTLTVGSQSIPITSAATPSTFPDLAPASYQFDGVNMLNTRGIYTAPAGPGASSCTAGYACSTATITRAEMAGWIIRSIYGNDSFSYSNTPYFSDVPAGYFNFGYIQKMYELGVTTGCAQAMYCPTEPLPREQMAVFVIKARLLGDPNFDYPATQYFTDVSPSDPAFKYVQRLRADNITTGCTATTFCPSANMVRGDLAIFLMRALFTQLLPAGTPHIFIDAVSPLLLSQGVAPLDQPATVIPAGTMGGILTLEGLNTSFSGSNPPTINPIPGVTFGSVTVVSPTRLSIPIESVASTNLYPQSIVVLPPGEPDVVLPVSFVAVASNNTINVDSPIWTPAMGSNNLPYYVCYFYSSSCPSGAEYTPSSNSGAYFVGSAYSDFVLPTGTGTPPYTSAIEFYPNPATNIFISAYPIDDQSYFWWNYGSNPPTKLSGMAKQLYNPGASMVSAQMSDIGYGLEMKATMAGDIVNNTGTITESLFFGQSLSYGSGQEYGFQRAISGNTDQASGGKNFTFFYWSTNPNCGFAPNSFCALSNQEYSNQNPIVISTDNFPGYANQDNDHFSFTNLKFAGASAYEHEFFYHAYFVPDAKAYRGLRFQVEIIDTATYALATCDQDAVNLPCSVAVYPQSWFYADLLYSNAAQGYYTVGVGEAGTPSVTTAINFDVFQVNAGKH